MKVRSSVGNFEILHLVAQSGFVGGEESVFFFFLFLNEEGYVGAEGVWCEIVEVGLGLSVRAEIVCGDFVE